MSKPTTLEASIKRLEEIVAQLGAEVPLDDAIKLYAEAVKLVDFSDAKLEAAKLKVEKLSVPKGKEADDESI
ncbi:exodeoxyribonuclease VII small subunit [Oscillospiraceae bacterium PP1C4]